MLKRDKSRLDKKADRQRRQAVQSQLCIRKAKPSGDIQRSFTPSNQARGRLVNCWSKDTQPSLAGKSSNNLFRMLKNTRLHNTQASMEKRTSLKIMGHHKGLKVRDRSPLQNSKIVNARIESLLQQRNANQPPMKLGPKGLESGKLTKNDIPEVPDKNATRGSARVKLSVKTTKRRTSSLLNIKYNEKVKKERDDFAKSVIIKNKNELK
uniref:Uncharacterized protein n=1 Tax=Euplotes crassus TaxID=5936 RepID=A0A7S3KSR4_EUPCR|mmetsp:Transcript_37764/g.37300  ORF Transcript_37764/g.37300 Transcript_37764/m.37300 type:complete len:209 (+) Transcript_37764:1-627(+)